MMAGCIHPSCMCKAYEDSKSSRSGTLVQFLGCHTCGHKAVEHRKLTSNDHFIQSEIAGAAKDNQCTHKIPTREIPLSPVFSSYDPLPLPIDSDADQPEKESGVQCTCLGFQFSNIVRLWQKFRTHSIKDIGESLQQIQCSFCQHPLSEHKLADKTDTKSCVALPGSVSWFQSLSLKGFVKLDTSIVADEKCVQVLMPSGTHRELVLVVLKNNENDCTSLLVHRRDLPSMKSGEDNIKNDDCKSSEDTQTLQALSLSSEDLSSSSKCNGQLPSTSSMESSDEIVPSRKRKHTCRRRSERLANAKKRKTELVYPGEARLPKSMEELKLLDVVNGRQQSDTLHEDTKSEEGEDIESLYRESKLVEETTISFVESLKSTPNYEQYALPKELQVPNLTVKMSVCCVGSANVLLVALGEGKRVFVSLISKDTREVKWIRLCYETPSGIITCLSWFAQSDVGNPTPSEFDCKLCAGTTSGVNVHLWSAKMSVSSNSLVCSQLGYCKNTESQLEVCCWSPNGKLICVGSLLGEVLFYSVDADASPVLAHIQTVECCQASVRTIAWSKDSCAVAVGGSDDCVQLLQCKSQQDNDEPLMHQTSILKFLIRERGEKFFHTHTIRGHQSFLADVQFLNTTSSHRKKRDLITLGWDGQLLLWTNLAVPSSLLGHHSGAHWKPTKQKDVVPLCTEVDPQMGLKIGPSMCVEFLPLSVHVVDRRGVVLVIRNRLGGISIICYFSKQHQNHTA